MPVRISDQIRFEAAYPRKRLPLFVRFIVMPLSMIAIMFVFTGAYSLSQAGSLMRYPSKPLEDFSVNILPPYSIASFTSFDRITPLSGWFFPAGASPAGTIVMVHGHRSNRLQFDSDTVALYRSLIDHQYNILSFDLRHSGNSGGNLSTFGYDEWQDVLAAISYVRQITSTRDVILYGFDTGASACLLGVNHLMEAAASSEGLPERFQALGFDHTYIRSFILDSPPASAEDPIRRLCIDEVFGGSWLGQYTIPYAVRLTSKAEKEYRMSVILGKIPNPVLIIPAHDENSFFAERSEWLISERTRLFPNFTAVWTNDTSVDMHPFLADQAGYLDAVKRFLDRYPSVR